MPRPIIPIRPSGQYDLRAEEMNCLTWIVLSGCAREEAFFRFVRPDYITPKPTPAMKDAVKQFFAMSDVQKYLADYKETISKLLSREPSDTDAPKKPQTLEERKARAKTKLVEFAMSIADDIEHADDPEFVLKVADKAGLLDTEEEVEVQPQRFLAERCSDCRYRVFCERECEDLCQYCRYKSFGEDNGVHYENKDMLDMPHKIGTKLEETTQPQNNE